MSDKELKPSFVMTDSEGEEIDYSDWFKEFCDSLWAERAYQLDKWEMEFDSKNTPNDWVAYISKYLGQSVTMPYDEDKFTEQLIKVATLCMAAIEWNDRLKGNMPKRHYD